MPRVEDVLDLSNFDQRIAEICQVYGIPMIAISYLRPITGMPDKYAIAGRLLVGYEGKEDYEAGTECIEIVMEALVEYCDAVDLPLLRIGNN